METIKIADVQIFNNNVLGFKVDNVMYLSYTIHYIFPNYLTNECRCYNYDKTNGYILTADSSIELLEFVDRYF